MANKKCISILIMISAMICSVRAKNKLLHEKNCEKVTSWMCEGIGYNFTTFPNAMNHQTQEDAHLDIVSFSLLLDTQCSTVIRFFMCSQYIPICIKNYHKPLKACRSLCERSRDECTPYWSLLNFDWPKEMACNLFPDETEELCLKPDNFESFCDCSCKSPLISTNDGNIGSVKNCTLPCRGAFFSKKMRNFINNWIKLFAGLSFICTLITLASFIMETEKSTYPKKSIKCLAFCSFMVSTGFLCSQIFGHDEVACDGRAIKLSSTDFSSCTIIFCMIYIFGMASSIWWVILSFTWFVSAGLKWSNESIEKYANYFHFIAWILPTLQAITVIWFGAIDGDPLAKICYVGNLNTQNLKMFVVIPSIIYFIIGSLLLLAGFWLLVHELHAKKPTIKQLIHNGMFSVLYMIPTSIIIGCQLYEISFYDKWMMHFTCPCNKVETQPAASLFLLKYFMQMAIGMISIIWILIGDRFISWKHFTPQIIRYNRNRVVHTLINENCITYNT